MAVMNTAEITKYVNAENNKMVPQINHVLEQIVERLKPSRPYRIVLFGSHAKGTASADSDIDLMVVVDDDFLPRNYSEKFEHDWEAVHKLIMDINREYALDVKVYSKREFKEVEALNSFFIQDVKKTGKVIYESIKQ
jgi:predicted nucleotidyltransferase